LGANLTLNGLGLPVNGGIVLDMKRMDRIIELNKLSRYVVVEPGVTQGRLGTYIEKNCPELEHSRPEAPPMATVVGNIVIRGHGYLAVKYGNNASQINGMEVVLPTGEICKTVERHNWCDHQTLSQAFPKTQNYGYRRICRARRGTGARFALANHADGYGG
jgi:FAD/FMN-containing dehydrogenase